jgi:hypothetical protein
MNHTHGPIGKAQAERTVGFKTGELSHLPLSIRVVNGERRSDWMRDGEPALQQRLSSILAPTTEL